MLNNILILGFYHKTSMNQIHRIFFRSVMCTITKQSNNINEENIICDQLNYFLIFYKEVFVNFLNHILVVLYLCTNRFERNFGNL